MLAVMAAPAAGSNSSPAWSGSDAMMSLDGTTHRLTPSIRRV